MPNDQRLPHFGPFRGLAALADILIVLGAGFLAGPFTLLVRPELGASWLLGEHYRLPVVLGALLTPSTMNWFGCYRSWRGLSFSAQMSPVILSMTTVFVVLAVIALATKTTAFYARTWMVNWIALSFLGVVLVRMVARAGLRALHSRGIDTVSIALIGGGALARRVVDHLRANPDTGLRAVGYFAAHAEEGADLPLRRLGDIDTLRHCIEQGDPEIEQLWIVLPLSAEEPIRRILHELRHSTVDIRMVPDMFGYHLLNYSTDSVHGLPVLNLSSSPLSGSNRLAKELLDRLVAAAALIAISPLMLLIAAAVKLGSPGPVMFRQARHGWDGKAFNVYKFRTMRCDATGAEQARRNDPRVTKLGTLLRRTSLDELPQLINVLQGRMSIVGPRPHPVELNDLFRDQVERYMWRHKVKPGITGWAQVNGYRGETDTLEKMRNRVEHDLYYIDNWSLWFDIKIMLLTLVHGFTHRNAY